VLPHAILEIPALLLAGALGLRVGLAWIRPLPGLGRWLSLRRLSRDFARSLLVVVPFLFTAALLEAYAQPLCFDRFVVLRRADAPGMSDERRIGGYYESKQAAWSPDGEHLAVVDSQDRLWLRSVADPASDTLLGEPDDEGAYGSPSWSPEGKRIAVIRQPLDFDDREHYALTLVDASSGELEVVPGGPTGRYLRAAWAPDGELIAVVVLEFSPDLYESRGINLWMVDVESGEWKKVTTFLPGAGVAAGSGLSWRPDGRALAFVKRRGQEEQRSSGASTPAEYVLCIAARDGAQIQQVTELRDSSDVAWSPEGDWLAYVWIAHPPDVASWTDEDMHRAPEPGEIRLIRPDGSGRTDDLARVDQLSSLSWSPEGTQLAYRRIGTTVIATPRVPALE
jgi:Tol biopolymer transport system component